MLETAVVSDIFSRIAEFFGTDRGTVLEELPVDSSPTFPAETA